MSYRPVRYGLHFFILQEDSFDGTTSVDLEVCLGHGPLANVHLKADVQVRGHAIVSHIDSPEVPGQAVPVCADTAAGSITIPLNPPSPPGARLRVTIHYTGILFDNMPSKLAPLNPVANRLQLSPLCSLSPYVDNDNWVSGPFGRSWYLPAHGLPPCPVVCTHLCSTHAPTAFPCIDDPSAKAVYTVAVTVPSHTWAVMSNAPLSARTLGADGSVQHEFRPWHACSSNTPPASCINPRDTVPLPPHLVAICAGPLDAIQASAGQAQVSVAVPAGMPVTRVELALSVLSRAVAFYEEFLDVPLPVPKVDIVGVPQHMEAGMENTGLVLCSLGSLTCDSTSTSAQRQAVAYLVAHETAHHWFGNLVTPASWEHVWLSEGFATWLGWRCTGALFPDWACADQTLITCMSEAMVVEACPCAHSLQATAALDSGNSPDTLFSTVSYYKGAAVVNMLHHFSGQDAFRRAACTYLTTHAHSSATTADLFRCFSDVTGKSDIGALFSAWTEPDTATHPVIKVVYQAGPPSHVVLTQHSLYSSKRITELFPGGVPMPGLQIVPSAPAEASFSDLPCTIVVGNAPPSALTIPADGLILPVPSPELHQTSGEPSIPRIIVNPGHAYLYCTLYDTALMTPLIRGIETRSLSPQDRCVLRFYYLPSLLLFCSHDAIHLVL
eukprot:gene6030-1078_t